eukprot:TRINITY_DN3023_c0_g1_i3.p1 TRINITY_DN3023_c0_g1~~TRINITY_DN3023_c0_g1_i3.p1  ORF type:complete len:139 (-),score=7.71 TRINITY_DN3023_c0_g1_i3:252-668(-)
MFKRDRSYPETKKPDLSSRAVKDEPWARQPRLFDPLTHQARYRPCTMMNSNLAPPKAVYKSKVFFGRTKGFLAGHVDDVIRCADSTSEAVKGKVTWNSAMQNQRTRSGMPKPFHPQMQPCTAYIHEAVLNKTGNPFKK